MKSLHNLALAVFFTANCANAQLIVSTGTPEGTYGAMFREANTECAADYKVVLTEWHGTDGKVSNGAVLNLDNLINNKANIAFAQMDVMRARALSDERVNGLRILFPLYDSEVHFIASKRARKEGGIFGIGAQTITYRTVSDFRGRTVGAWGGSYVTAAYINQNAELGMKLVEYRKEDEGLAALKNGDLDGVIAVGGQPLAWVSKLSNTDYQLLTVDPATSAKLGKYYKVGTLTYPGLGAIGLKTFTTHEVLVTRQYKTQEKAEALGRIALCFKERLDKLAETTGNHAKWASITPEQKVDWPYFQAPEIAVKRRNGAQVREGNLQP